MFSYSCKKSNWVSVFLSSVSLANTSASPLCWCNLLCGFQDNFPSISILDIEFYLLEVNRPHRREVWLDVQPFPEMGGYWTYYLQYLSIVIYLYFINIIIAFTALNFNTLNKHYLYGFIFYYILLFIYMPYFFSPLHFFHFYKHFS